MHRPRLVILSCCALALASLGLRAIEPAAAGPMLDEPQRLGLLAAPIDVAAPASIEQLRARIAAVLEREGVPGVGLALVDVDGVRWAGGVGVASRETGRPVDADTQFRVASITKSLVALGVMRLVEQGKLDLGAPLAALMPEIAIENAWPDSPITLAHALEHTAGFDEMRFNEYFGTEHMSPREALAINPRSRVARWRPGSRPSYSNPGYTIAGHAIERATGERYDAWLEREVLRPIGMPSARFRDAPEYADRRAAGYKDPQTPAPAWQIAHRPAGALLASPRELAELVAMWLRRDGGGVVGPASLDRIERTGTLPYASTDTNYGLGNYGDVLHPVRSRGHDGGLPGFLSCYRYFPDLGVGYVMLLNSQHSVRAYLEIRALLFAYLTRGKLLPEPPRAAPDPEAIAAASAYYGYASPRVELAGFVERALIGFDVRPDADGISLAALTGGSFRMLPTGDGGFRAPHEGGTNVRLTTDIGGRRVLHTGLAHFEEASHAWARARLLLLQSALLLLNVAPLWALAWAMWSGLRRVRGGTRIPGEAGLHLWPAFASVLFAVMQLLMMQILERDAFATANPLSVGLCASTLAFAAASAAALAAALRAGARGIAWTTRLVPGAAALACFGLTLYLLVHGIIGLRTWAW